MYSTSLLTPHFPPQSHIRATGNRRGGGKIARLRAAKLLNPKRSGSLAVWHWQTRVAQPAIPKAAVLDSDHLRPF